MALRSAKPSHQDLLPNHLLRNPQLHLWHWQMPFTPAGRRQGKRQKWIRPFGTVREITATQSCSSFLILFLYILLIFRIVQFLTESAAVINGLFINFGRHLYETGLATVTFQLLRRPLLATLLQRSPTLPS